MQGSAVYFDGLRPIPRQAELALAAKGISLSIDGGPFFSWDYGSVRLEEDGPLPLRFHREESHSHTGEVLEIHDADFAAALKARCPSLGGTQQERGRMRMKIIGWSLAAVISMVGLVLYGIPALATYLAPVVPWKTEVALGRAVEGEVLRQLTDGPGKICGAEGNGPGKRALQAMVERLTRHAVLPGEIDVKVLDSNVQNAFTLPGGKIVFMRALIERARSPDEVAGVLAHEMGHVAHRDAMRGIIHAGGISFLVGTLLGDFTGAGALVIGTKFLLGSRYSRENESQADDFAIDVMTKAGGDVKALGTFLRRVASSPGERQLELVLSHPVTDDRIAAINSRAPSGARTPLLNEAEWQALQKICKDG
jgi:Zn-dependent protease with chaperone function